MERLLFDKYRPVGLVSGGELLLRHSEALQFIDDCEDLGLEILGMDFYAREEGRTLEVGSTDWASLTEGPGAFGASIGEARSLIGRGLPDDADLVSFVVRGLRERNETPQPKDPT
jgi:hypothetical protein